MKKSNPSSGPPGPAGNARSPAKKPSGAQNRKNKKAQKEAERRAEAARAAGLPPAAGAAASLARYAACGPAPRGKVNEGLPWAHDVLLQVIEETISDPHTDAPTRRRVVTDCVRALGATYSKAHMQARLIEIQKWDAQHLNPVFAPGDPDFLEPNPLYKPRAAQLAADLDDEDE